MQKHLQRLVLVATIAAASLVLAACSSSPAPAGSSTTKPAQLTDVSVAVLAPGSLQWLQAIADHEGFYKKNGVNVKAVQVQTSAALVQAVASGSANAGIAEGNTTMGAINQGANVIITGALFQRAALRLFGGSGVTKVSQLAGTKVTAGAVQGGTYDLMLYLLKEGGVDGSKVTPVAIANSSDRVVALQNDQVKGALLIPPFDTLAKQQGSTPLSAYSDYYVETPSIVNTSWAKSNPKGARGFTQGLKAAAQWIYDPANKQAAINILAEYASVDKKAAQDAYTFLVGSKIISPDLSVPSTGLSNMVKVSGGDVSSFKQAKYVTDQFLK